MIIEIKDIPTGQKIQKITFDVVFVEYSDSSGNVLSKEIQQFSDIPVTNVSAEITSKSDEVREAKPVPKEMLDVEF